MIEYEDFSLKIEPKRGDAYPVIVLRSPAGEGRSSFRLPFDPGDIGHLLLNLARTTRQSSAQPQRQLTPPLPEAGPQEIGEQLFNSLFSGTVRTLLDQSLGMIHRSQQGLRIKLHIDPEEPSLAQLASLPWEFLYRKETREFLNLSRFTPVLRYLDVQRPYTPLPLEPPLRILVVISDPVDAPRLDLDRERAMIEDSWARQTGVQADFVERATLMALQDRLAEKPYHVLHYMGHGDFDEQTGQGVLVMEDEDGRAALVDGTTLAVLLCDVRTLRLVFLNACETARVTKEKGLDPFAGAAAAMIMAGIPAVVAMQFPISDSAAISFARRFYPLLARGDPVDAAVAEGRRAIRLAESQTMEWGTPVLFMRAPQGIIFQTVEGGVKEQRPELPEEPQAPDEDLAQRLESLYTRGLGAFWLEEWAKAAQSFQAIVDLRPGYEDAEEKLAESRRQEKLASLHGQAQAAQEAGDWGGAVVALEELQVEEANYPGIAVMVETARKQKELAELYAEAKRLHGAQQWPAAVNVFAQIRTLDPDYPDPDGLLASAEREAAQAAREEELSGLHARAVRAMNTGQCQEAAELLRQLQKIAPGYRDTRRLLARVEKVLEAEEAARQRQQLVGRLYEEALKLAGAGQWNQALAKMDEVRALDPEFADPEQITVRAREEIEREEEATSLYAEAVRLVKTGQFQTALDQWAEVQALVPGFRDRKKVQSKAEKGLAAQARGDSPRQGVPRWALLAVAGVVVAAIAAILILRGGLPGLDTPGMGDSTTPGVAAGAGPSTAATPLSTTMPEAGPASAGETSYNQAMRLLDEGSFEESIAQFDQALELGWEPGELYFFRGSAYEQLGRRGEAEADYQTYLEKVREDPGAEFRQAAQERLAQPFLDYGVSLLDQGEYEKAIFQFDQAFGQGWETPNLYYFRGVACEELGRREEAEEAYQTYLALTQDDPGAEFRDAAQLGLAQPYMDDSATLMDRGEYEEAHAQLDQAIAAGYQAAELYAQRGAACFAWWLRDDGCDLEQCIADLTDAIDMDSERSWFWVTRGLCYAGQGNDQKALEDQTRAIELDPGNDGAFHERAGIYHRTGDLALAVDDLSKAIQLQPLNHVYYKARGWAYHEAGDDAAALEDYGKAIALAPGWADAYEERAYVYTAMGDLQRAADDLTEAIRLVPDGLIYLYARGALYFDLIGDTPAALKDFDRLVELAPDEPTYLHRRGLAYERLGQDSQARKDYEAYMELTGGDPAAAGYEHIQAWLAAHPE